MFIAYDNFIVYKDGKKGWQVHDLRDIGRVHCSADKPMSIYKMREKVARMAQRIKYNKLKSKSNRLRRWLGNLTH